MAAYSKKPSRTRIVRESERKKKLSANKEQLQGILFRVFLIVILLVLIFVIISNQTALSCLNMSQCARNSPLLAGSGNGYPVTISGSRILQTDTVAGNLAVLSDTNFQVFNKSAKPACSRNHFLSRPVMKTDGYYAVLVDIGDTGFRLEGVSETLLEGDYDQTLISCAVSESGRFALVSQGSSHNSAMLSSVDVIDAKGDSLHKWHTSDYYINDAALNSSGKRLAMCGITAHSGYLHSVVIIHKVGSRDQLARIDCPDVMLYSVFFNENDTLVAIGDKSIYFIDDEFNVTSCEFEGQLLAYDFDKDYGTAVCTSEISGADSGRLTLYDTNGGERFSKSVDINCSSVSVSSGGCCLLGKGELMCLRLNGGLVGRWQTNTTPSNVVMILRGAYLSDGISIRYQELTSQRQSE